MESMRRSEENTSHHPKEVAINSSIATGSNTKNSKLTENVSSSTGPVSLTLNKKLNTKPQLQQASSNIILQKNPNRKTAISQRLISTSKNSAQTGGNLDVNISISSLKSTAQQAVASTTSPSSSSICSISISNECKDTNFEYEDEWDIGGIPELLDDLDADIEKSSSAAQQQLGSVINNSGGGSNAIINRAQTTTILSTGINSETDPLSPSSVSTLAAIELKSSSLKVLEKSLTASGKSNKHSCQHHCSSSNTTSGDNSTRNSSLLAHDESSDKTSIQKSTVLKSYKLQQSVSATQLINDVNIKGILADIPPFKSTDANPSPLLSSSNLLNAGSSQSSNKITSNFTGFAKGGNLVTSHGSTSSNSYFPNCLAVATNTSTSTLSPFQTTSGMSSQSSGGSGSNNTSSGGGTSVNQGSTQSSGSSGNSGKSTAKMSIDHQATLDKGLKMKIKRTKPGTKTSEAKHEIVKATEQQQQQNGNLSGGNSNNLDENSGPSSSSHPSASSSINSGGSNSSTSNSGSANTNIGGVGNSNKKHLSNISSNGSNNSNQGNSHSSGSNNNSGQGAGNNSGGGSSQTTPQSTKRGSSGHRRDKAKEKMTHSNRLIAEKLPTGNEKETANTVDKSSGCQCNGDSSTNGSSSCTNHTCARRSENATANILSQRISNSTGNNSTTSGTVPPGVFTPSIGSPAAGTSSTTSLLSATTVASSTPSSQCATNSSGPNAPGPPGKDASTCGSIKISSHIAAQLAAAAASNSFSSNASSTSSGNISGNAEGKVGPIVSGTQTKLVAPGMISATVHHTILVPANSSTVNTGAATTNATCSIGSSSIGSVDDGIKSPPAKRAKHGEQASVMNVSAKEMVDICIGTSVGTITEPDCLGPCEPGTSVTLEGIVWHETEGGVLVVNVTWRGKTYVGTLLDCTRHDWAPPRFCDSPTEELDSRTPKGRGKRGRSAALTPDLSNFTETRSSIYFSHAQVHSKLRNGATKGRGTSRATISGTNATTTTTVSSSSSSGNGGGATPSTSPTAFLPPRSEKRKSKDESPSPINGDNECTGNVANASGIPISTSGGALTTQPQSLVNPVTGLNVQISTKKCKTASPCAISPVLLECPEQDCSKKYKHANGLRYHQSAAHGSGGSMDEDSLHLPEEPPTSPSPVLNAQHPPTTTLTASEMDTTTMGTTPLGSPASSSATAVINSVASVSTTSSPGSSLQPPQQLSQQSSSGSSTDAIPAATPTITGSATSIINVPDKVAVSNSLSSVLLTSTQSAQLPPPLLTTPSQHSVAGGSITAGISGQALSQQQNLGISNTGNMPQLLSEQQQTILHQNTLKSGVLRFGQPNDTPNSLSSSSLLSLQQQGVGQCPPVGAQTNSLSGQSNLRAPTHLPPTSEALQSQQQPSASPYSNVTATTTQNLQQGISLSTKSSTGFPVAGKQKKSRKSPGPCEYDGVMSRDDVQSPAYSDISDDSTPVGDQEIIEKSQPSKHLDLLNKKPVEIGSANIGSASQPMPAMGSYGMYQFYQQQQYMVPPSADQQQAQVSNKTLLPPTIGQQGLALPIPQAQQQIAPPPHHIQQQQTPHLTDYTNKNKDPPLDLITKPVTTQQQSIGQPHQSQDNIGNQKDNSSTQPPPSVNLSNVGPSGNGLPPGLGGLTALTPGVVPGGISTPAPTKPISHFYPFNYMTPGYPYNVEPNYGPVSIVSPEDAVKLTAHGGIQSSQGQSAPSQHQSSSGIKDERTKESPSPHDGSKLTSQQMVSTKIIKAEPLTKQEIKQEPSTNAPMQAQQSATAQQPHVIHPKDLQGLGAYPNIYQRHPMSLAAQQHLSREEELRRYYILSEEQRRAAAAIRAVQAQSSSSGGPPNILQSQMAVQHKDDLNSTSQHSQQLSIAQQQQQSLQQHQHQHQHQHQQQKPKSQSSISNLNTGCSKAANLSKETPKQKQDEEVKVKQEGQKPTMETQGPPPPPTSQYFLHPSYIAPAPFSFDPNHPMYRNVLMSAAGPYNAPPYHLPIPRYHAPEDLSRNAGTKALDALHHAASQYYTTHKIHELSERALKSPTSGSVSGPSGPVKVSVSSPNVGVQQQSNNTINATVSGSAPNAGSSGPNSGSHLSATNQSGSGTSMNLNLQPPSNVMSGPTSKSDVMSQKTLNASSSSSSVMTGGPINIDQHKQQGGSGSSGSSTSGSNASGAAGSSASCGATPTDSRSPPPQRHVHTHHHTHVGLGYPMYTAPYGAAVLASQQAAAVAVINPFPPGPTK